MMKKVKLLFSQITAVTVFLSGCSITQGIDQQGASVDLDKARIQAIKNDEPKYKRIILNEQFYVPPVTAEAILLPSWYSAPITMRQVNVPLKIVIDEAVKGLPVTVVFNDLTKADIEQEISISVNEQPLGEVLKIIGDQAGVAITYSQGRAVYSKYERRTFPLVALPGTQTSVMGRDGQTTTSTSNNLSGASASMTATSSGQYSVIKLQDHDPLEQLKKSIEAVLSKEGQVGFNASGPSVTIKDIPYNVAEAEKVVRDFNDDMSRMVEIEVNLLDVIYSEDNQLAMDYRLMMDAFGDSASIVGGGGFTSGGAGTLTPSSFVLEILRGDMKGTEILVDALKRQGAVSRTVFQKVVTTNGTLGRSKAVTRDFYIAEQYGSNATTGGVITSGGSRQEMLETGQVLNVLPRIFNDDVFVKINSTISADLGITTKSNEATGTYVESPKVADMEFDQTLIVPHGKTLVIGGMEIDSALTTLQNAGYDVAGFNKVGKSENKETILTITATITRGKERI
jgi:hypothetical protein